MPEKSTCLYRLMLVLTDMFLHAVAALEQAKEAIVERCRDEDKREQQGKSSLSNTSLSSHALHHVQSRHGDGALGGISANTGKTIDLTARLAWLDALEQFAKMQVERKDLDAPNVGSHDSILAECEDSPSRQRRAQLSAAYSGDVLTLRERKQELLTGNAS